MKRLIKRLGRRLSSIADGFAHRVGRRFSPATNHTPPPTPQPRTNLLVSLLGNRIQAEDYFLKHAHLIEEYSDKTCQEWRRFIQDEQELERRKNLLLQSIGQKLLQYANLGPNGQGSPSVILGEDFKVQEDVRDESPLLPIVHILSPTVRSGTNLLGFLLIESGCCQWPLRDHVQAEDYFLKHAHLIEEYGDKTCQEWRRFIQDEQELERRKNLLLQSIGQGLVHYASPHTLNAPIVLKTPDSDNVDLLPRLFPQSRVLFIIRDGRDTVESAATAFPLASYEHWMNCWAEGARRLLEFMERPEENLPTVNWKLIRYEELISEQSPIVQEIFDFLGSKSELTWRDLHSLPVYGSSYLSRENGKFKWAINAKPENFNPFGRWTLWGEDRKQKFKEIAGAELIKLQYVKDDRW